MGVITTFLVAILIGLVVRWWATEVGVWHRPLCQWLVRLAAARLPVDERLAIESEWLAVIEDLRSPTAQLLHSLSYVLSSLRIRQAIAPEAPLPSYMRTILAIQAAGFGFIAGGGAALLWYYQDKFVESLKHQITISKPAALVLMVLLTLVNGAVFYLNHRILVWYYHRRQRRRANTQDQ
jgi:hypothetical protein